VRTGNIIIIIIIININIINSSMTICTRNKSMNKNHFSQYKETKKRETERNKKEREESENSANPRKDTFVTYALQSL
jgi:hypothetical protein